ncbi:MAG: hypothetical protein ACOCR0_03510 [Haloferacaceae archaeon]
MPELGRVLAEADVDDDALQEAAAAAYAVLEARDVDTEGVAPVLHEDAHTAGQQAIDRAVTGEPTHELVVAPVHGDARRYRISPNPDPGAPYLLTEAHWTGCAWRHAGTEDLARVEIDGDAWHEADAVETTRGP